MLQDNQIKEFLSDLASSSPAPGGGSASALIGAVGCALSGMLASLTISKKKFNELSETNQNDFKKNYQIILDNMDKFQKLMDDDLTCYPAFLEAYRLPKETLEENRVRDAAIEKAAIHACEIPLDIMRTAYKTIKASSNLLHDGNRNVLPDLLSGIVLLNSTVEIAAFNVFANLPSIIDFDLKKKYYDEAKELVEYSKELKESIVEGYKPR